MQVGGTHVPSSHDSCVLRERHCFQGPRPRRDAHGSFQSGRIEAVGVPSTAHDTLQHNTMPPTTRECNTNTNRTHTHTHTHTTRANPGNITHGEEGMESTSACRFSPQYQWAVRTYGGCQAGKGKRRESRGESQRNAGEKERDLSEAAMHIRRMDEEMAIVRGQLEASRQQQLQAEDQLGAALQRERELRASLEAADAHVAQLEAALQTTATAAEVSHVTRDEAFLRMTQAVEHKSEENAQLVLALREQRRQLDRLQDQMATAALRRNEHDPGRPDLQRVVDTQALLLRQREEEVRAVTRLEAAKDRQLALLQSEVRRLLAGRPITDLYPSLGLLSNTEVRGLPILDEEQRWMATAPMNNLPGIGYLAACPPPTLPSFTADEITSLRSSHSGASGLGRLHDLRCELEEARLKRERLLSAVDL
eukprot:GGOE01054509.1.p1 GENE.GGOE01054509.1~~GGOE01054509.1.p1  ORF type:complete len:422 (-),score=87.34 GGOE01054509.1:106-1371(-)